MIHGNKVAAYFFVMDGLNAKRIKLVFSGFAKLSMCCMREAMGGFGGLNNPICFRDTHAICTQLMRNYWVLLSRHQTYSVIGCCTEIYRFECHILYWGGE